MSILKALCTVSVLLFSLPTVASATTLLHSITLDFGIGKVDEISVVGNNTVNANSVTVDDFNKGTVDFPGLPVRPNFNFNHIGHQSVSHFIISLEFAGLDNATPALGADGRALSGTDPIGELWWAEVRGSSDGIDRSYFHRLDNTEKDSNGIVSFRLDSTNDGGELGSDRTDGMDNDAFQSSVDEGILRLRLREESAMNDTLELLSASVEIYGAPAPVPIPASSALLFGALGGLAAWKRRRAVI